MKRKTKISRSSVTGKFNTGSLGASKAEKFSLVEGITLSQRSCKVLERNKSKGLKGNKLRMAINKSFAK